MKRELPEAEIISEAIVSPYYLYLRSDGIMYVRISSEKNESVELVKKMVEKMGEMTGGKTVPILARHDDFAIPGKANIDYWARKESCPYSKADAFIIKSLATKIIANIYLKMNKPERPTRMFTEVNEALSWLKTFL